jgi:hypothetical protein
MGPKAPGAPLETIGFKNPNRIMRIGMAEQNDNRMGWIRNLEALQAGRPPYTVEYELGSDCRIIGLLDYDQARMICAPVSLEQSRSGLFLYNLTMKYPLYPQANLKADDKGYYFKDGIFGELLALMSLHFRCRFFLISTRSLPDDPTRGMTIKREYDISYRKCDPAVHPPVFENKTERNFATDLKDFLGLAKRLDTSLHQKFMLACYHYARALKEIGIDAEMVFIRLVSAIEVLSQDLTLENRDDALEAQEIVGLIAGSKLSSESKRELQAIFDVRKSRKKFSRFIEQYCEGFFEETTSAPDHTKIKSDDLSKVLNAIYTARSKYLHAGEPMFLSMPMRGGETWDTDPGFEMIIDNRVLTASQKLPYTWFFEGLVRTCLLNFLQKHQQLEFLR